MTRVDRRYRPVTDRRSSDARGPVRTTARPRSDANSITEAKSGRRECSRRRLASVDVELATYAVGWPLLGHRERFAGRPTPANSSAEAPPSPILANANPRSRGTPAGHGCRPRRPSAASSGDSRSRPRARSPTSNQQPRADPGSANGGGGIRTRGPLSRTPVFKTGALNRSATPPDRNLTPARSHTSGHDWAMMVRWRIASLRISAVYTASGWHPTPRAPGGRRTAASCSSTSPASHR